MACLRLLHFWAFCMTEEEEHRAEPAHRAKHEAMHQHFCPRAARVVARALYPLLQRALPGL